MGAQQPHFQSRKVPSGTHRPPDCSGVFHQEDTLIIHPSEIGINLDLKVCNCPNKYYIVRVFWLCLLGMKGYCWRTGWTRRCSHWPNPASPLLRQAGALKALCDSWNHQRTAWLWTMITPSAQKDIGRSNNHHNLWTYWKSYSSCLLCWVSRLKPQRERKHQGSAGD